MGSLAWAPATRPKLNPSPSGEGGRRPGEGSPTALPAPFRAIPSGAVTLSTLTPTLSQRERGSEGGEPGLGTLDPSQIQPLSLWERVAKAGATRPKLNPSPSGEGGRRPGEGAPQPCLCHSVPYRRAACSGHPHPNPHPEGEGAGGWGAWPGHPRPVPNPTPLPLREGGQRPERPVPNSTPLPLGEGGRRPVRAPNNPAAPIHCP